jgi:hypothetical protein
MLALFILSLSPATVFADDKAKPLEERGVIKSVDLDAHTLVVTDPKKHVEQKFLWNEETKFSEHAKSVSASALKQALKQGERVHFKYAPGGNTPVLQSVHLAPPKTHKHSNFSPARSSGA